MKKTLFLLMLLIAIINSGCGEKTIEPEKPEKNEYKIVFEENGGTEVNDFEKEAGSEVVLPIVLKEGYNFLGWYKDSLYTQKVNEKIIVEDDLTLYAKWEVIKFTISFKNSELDELIVEYNSKLPEVNPYKEGYTFKGWYLDNEYINQYNCDINIKEDYTLYAKWEINTYQIKFINIAQEDIMVEFRSKLPSIDIPEKEGYTFKGFYLDEEYKNSWDIENDLIVQDIVLYAKYEINKYLIEFVDVDLDDIVVEHNGLIPKPSEIEKEGYNFLGWYKDEDFKEEWNFKKNKVNKDTKLYPKFVAKRYLIKLEGLESFYAPYDSLLEDPGRTASSEKTLVGWYKDKDFTYQWNFKTDTVKGDTHLYPKYVPKYLVTFMLDGVASHRVTQDYSCPKPNTPTKSGYIFGGWFKDETLTSEWDFSNDKVVEEITLYPGWKKIIEDENGLVYLQSVDGKTCTVYEYKGTSETVILPRSISGIEIVGIERTAFSNNLKIKNINIPDTIKKIENDSFNNCVMLEKIEVDKNNPNYKTIDGILYSKDGKRLIRYPALKIKTLFDIPNGVEVIEDCAFRGSIYLNTINIPESVCEIDSGAFLGCTALKNIVLPNGLVEIEVNLFTGCESLESVNIPQNVVTIKDGAFSGCINLTNVVIPSSVMKIEDNVFWNCFLLEKIEVAQDNLNYRSIDDVLYSKDGTILIKYAPKKLDKKYQVLEGVKIIEGCAFENATLLEQIELPDGLIQIKDQAFAQCTSLKEIILPNTVTDVGFGIFYKCTSLTRVKLSDSMIKIEANMFTYCSSLKEIVIPESVTEIGDYAFNLCSSLISIYIPENVTKVGTMVFSACDVLTIRCEAPSKPYGWSESWNLSNVLVLWDCDK